MRIVMTQAKPLDPEVIIAAAKVRAEVQRWAEKLKVWQIEPETMCGACGIASYLLHEALTKKEIKSIFVMGRYYPSGYENRSKWDEESVKKPNHCWLVVGGWIVDITATQFGILPEVAVYEKDCDYYHTLHSGSSAIKILNTSWDEQSPACYSEDMRKLRTKVAA